VCFSPHTHVQLRSAGWAWQETELPGLVSTTNVLRMRTSMRGDLTAALKARDRVAVSALRSALAAIENAEAPAADHPGVRAVESEHIAGSVVGQGAAEVERNDLSDLELHAIVETEVQERSVAAAEYERIGRDDLAQRLRAEADVLSRYLRQAR